MVRHHHQAVVGRNHGARGTRAFGRAAEAGPEREAWLAATAAALGSNLWCTASQTLWQHGPAALMLTLVVLLLLPESPSPLRFFLAGLAAALLVCARPIALGFAVVTALWVTLRHPRMLVWFLPPAALIGYALLRYNHAYLGNAMGRYSPFEAALFATPWQEGLLGTLLSPNRGLFVFSPWTIVAFAYLPFAFSRLRVQNALALAAGDVDRARSFGLKIHGLVGRMEFRSALLDRGHSLAGDCSRFVRSSGGAPLPGRSMRSLWS